MQLASCDFAAGLRCPVTAAWSCRRPSLTKRKPAAAVAKRCAASRRDDAEFSCSGGSGRLVDEGMVVLRRRIHEMRAAERGSWEPPAERVAASEESDSVWCGAYDAGDVCGLVSALQALLLSSRPGVGVGLVATLLFVLAVPASAFVLVSHLVDTSRGVLSNLPH